MSSDSLRRNGLGNEGTTPCLHVHWAALTIRFDYRPGHGERSHHAGPQPRTRAGPSHRIGGDGRFPLDGSGDKEGADGARSMPCATCVRSVSMDGVVVIGEGEKDEAPMLYNGERIGDGTDAETDIAVDLDRRHDPDRPRPRQRAGRHRRVAPGHHVRPRSVHVHGKDCGRPRRRGQSASTRRSPRTSTMWPRRRVRKCRISPSSSSTVTDTPTTYARYERPALGSVSSPTVMSPAPSRPPGPTLAPTSSSASVARPEGVITAAALKCMGGEQLGRLWPRNDRERQQAIDQGYDLDRILTVDDLDRVTTASSPPPASPTVTCSPACTSTVRAPRPNPRDAIEVGNGPPGHGPPPAGEGQRVLRHRVPNHATKGPRHPPQREGQGRRLLNAHHDTPWRTRPPRRSSPLRHLRG